MKKSYLMTAEEMKACDQFTTECLHIPSMVLMERAALCVVDFLKREFPEIAKEKILVVCGNGNNGGDGLAVARLLIDEGCKVDILMNNSNCRSSNENLEQLKILRAYGKQILYDMPDSNYSIIIDAILGIGLSRDIKGIFKDWIDFINAADAFVLSVDIPSGIDSDNGKCLGVAVKADATVTFELKKRGHFFYPGKEFSGRVVCCPVGISGKPCTKKEPQCFTYDEYFGNILPHRDESGNKGTFGKLLIVAGQKDMCGAALLCAEGALRSGAGMVKVVTDEANRLIFQTKLPDVMLLTYTGEKINTEKLNQSLEWADAVVVGPGAGTSGIPVQILKECLKVARNQPLILDADAINMISGDDGLRETVLKRERGCPRIVFTPHAGELARLAKVTVDQIKNSPLKIAKKIAAEFDAVVVSKDSTTLVCDNQYSFYLNTAGNCGMAVAGSGDVLTGVIGSFFAQACKSTGESDLEVASRAVYVHSVAGDIEKGILGETALTASDIIKGIVLISKESGKKEKI